MQPMQLWFILEVSLADIGSFISQLPDTRGVFGQYCRFLWLIPDVSVADTGSTCFRYWRYPGQIREVSVFETRGACGWHFKWLILDYYMADTIYGICVCVTWWVCGQYCRCLWPILDESVGDAGCVCGQYWVCLWPILSVFVDNNVSVCDLYCMSLCPILVCLWPILSVFVASVSYPTSSILWVGPGYKVNI